MLLFIGFVVMTNYAATLATDALLKILEKWAAPLKTAELKGACLVGMLQAEHAELGVNSANSALLVPRCLLQ